MIEENEILIMTVVVVWRALQHQANIAGKRMHC